MKRRASGFTYIGVLFAVALAGVALALTAQVWRTTNQRAKEEQLLFVGGQFREAIRRYHEQSPGEQREYPKNFEDLLQDRRQPGVRRHLRMLYPDPMTGKFDWGVERSPEGGIAGVYSRSQERPIRISGNVAGVDLSGRTKYSEWLFVYEAAPGAAPAPAATGGTAAQPQNRAQQRAVRQ
jgi:type II secretory pathway pseudopilin PulG